MVEHGSASFAGVVDKNTLLKIVTWQIFHISNLLFIAFNLGCAFAPTSGALIALRFFSASIYAEFYGVCADRYYAQAASLAALELRSAVEA